MINYQELKKWYNSVPALENMNYFKIPCSIIPTTDEGMDSFNEIVDFLHSENYNRLIRTPSGGLSITEEALRRLPAYDITVWKGGCEICIISRDMFRIQFRTSFAKNPDGSDAETSGHNSYKSFYKICKNHYGVDLDALKISKEEGKKIKSEIPAPRIDLVDEFANVVWGEGRYPSVNHLDIHSSHMAGVAEAFPVLYPPINYCYKSRKKNQMFKSIMTHTWGFMQSRWNPVCYQLSHLSKSGIEFTNRKIDELTKKLQEAGREIIMHNTDGIWYAGEIYHGEGEGKELGQWSNDHINCKFRAKSAGIYEYIENDEYHVVARGRFELDKEKPRDMWEWGDIYHTGKCKKYLYLPSSEKITKE